MDDRFGPCDSPVELPATHHRRQGNFSSQEVDPSCTEEIIARSGGDRISPYP
jgi:hypothetical protein